MIVSTMVGTFAGAIFVHKWQPRPRVIAWHNAVVTIISVIGISALMAIDCDTLKQTELTPHGDVRYVYLC